MNNELFIGLVSQLKEEREEQKALIAAKKEMENEFANNPEYARISNELKESINKVGNTEKMLKKGLMDDPEYIPPFKAAWLINSTEVTIDEEKALVWAKVNMAAAVSEVVDKKMLTDFAKSNPNAAPYAVITEGKDVRIASDLGKFAEIAES